MRLTIAISSAAVLAACTSASPPSTPAPDVTPSLNLAPPSPDPRIGLKSGWWDAGEAIWNMRMVSTTRPSEKFVGPQPGDARLKNSGLGFTGRYVVQGNYSGWQIWDVSNPGRPKL